MYVSHPFLEFHLIGTKFHLQFQTKSPWLLLFRVISTLVTFIPLKDNLWGNLHYSSSKIHYKLFHIHLAPLYHNRGC